MAHNLMADSSVYTEQAELYDRFSQAEDAEGKVFTALLPELKGKTVLDIGCGTGKYLALFAPHVKHITGVDVSAAQLAVAQDKTRAFKNVSIVEGDAATVALPQKYDVIFSTWALGTIIDDAHRGAVLQHMRRLLNPDGKIFLVENDEGGEFEDLRGRVDDPLQRTRRYNEWLLAQGFRILQRVQTSFSFQNHKEACDIFGKIWGPQAAQKINKPAIEHRVIVLLMEKA